MCGTCVCGGGGGGERHKLARRSDMTHGGTVGPRQRRCWLIPAADQSEDRFSDCSVMATAKRSCQGQPTLSVTGPSECFSCCHRLSWPEKQLECKSQCIQTDQSCLELKCRSVLHLSFSGHNVRVHQGYVCDRVSRQCVHGGRCVGIRV